MHSMMECLALFGTGAVRSRCDSMDGIPMPSGQRVLRAENCLKLRAGLLILLRTHRMRRTMPLNVGLLSQFGLPT